MRFMVKVVVGKLSGGKATSKAAKASVIERRILTTDGVLTTVRTLDASSGTFGADLQYVFSKNVAKARRDNRKLTGSADIAVPKR